MFEAFGNDWQSRGTFATLLEAAEAVVYAHKNCHSGQGWIQQGDRVITLHEALFILNDVD